MHTVTIASNADWPRLERLWGDIERQEQPGDDEAVERAVRKMRRSLAAFDSLEASSFWIFSAAADQHSVGYATAARIPKLDARVDFLFINELHVLQSHRLQGHATRLLELATSHATALGLGGLHLLVAPDNSPARRCYARLGLTERNLILAERSRDPS